MEEMRKCIRCHGRKKLFKTGGAYSFVDTGGVFVDCPMCLGEGKIKTLEQAVKDSKEKLEKQATSKPKRTRKVSENG